MSYYATESKVYSVSGFTSTKIQAITGKSQAEVTTLINDFLHDANDAIQDEIKKPITIKEELHYADGEKNIFDLGTEDEENNFNFNIDGCLEKIINCWFDQEKKLRPYPTDCDSLTESTASSFGVSNATVTDESTIVKCGTKSIKSVFTASGYIEYPSAKTLNLNIDVYDYVSFWIYSSNASVTFTLKLYDKDGNNNEQSFTVDKANVWYDIHIKIDSFDTFNVNWEDVKLYYWRLYANNACTVYIDGFNFNDEWSFVAPSGKLVISVDTTHGDQPPAEDYPFYISYTYDPFKSSVPQSINEACACLAAIALIDHLRGNRYIDTHFDLEMETVNVDEDTGRPQGLLAVRSMLEKRYDKAMARYGSSGSYGVIM